MEAIILGTAAAEGIPALFCGCQACRAARAAGGKEIRARQSLFLPPDILIDLGPDCLYAVQRFGLDWSGLEAILYTHSHDDHCVPHELGYTKAVFANDRLVAKTTLFGNRAVQEKLAGIVEKTPDVEFKPAVPFEPIDLPNARAVPIRSYHRDMEIEETLNYILTRDGKTLLYACDTGQYDEETWAYLKGIRLDAVLMECTFGTKARDPKWPYHMGLPDVVEVRARLLDQGTVREDTPYFATHFSHNGIVPYDEFQALASPHNITIAYDGLRLSL